MKSYTKTRSRGIRALISRTCCLLVLLLYSGFATLPFSMANAEETPADKPSIADFVNCADNYFGQKINDPYRWMETDNEKLLDYLRKQNDYTRRVLEQLGAARRKLLERIRELDVAVSIVRYWRRAADRIFFLETPKSTMSTTLMVKEKDGKVRQLFEPVNIAPKGTHSSLDYYLPSDDGKLVLVGVSLGGSEDSSIYVIDVDSGILLPEKISRAQYAFPCWRSDCKSFYYSRLQELQNGAAKNAVYENERVYLHKIGDDPEKDLAIFGADVSPSLKLPKYGFAGVGTEVGSPYLIACHSSGTSESQSVYYTDSNKADSTNVSWTQVLSKDDKLASEVQSNLLLHGTDLYLLIQKDAPNRKVICIDLNNPDLNNPDLKSARVIVPESSNVIMGIFGAADALYLVYRNGISFGLKRIPYEKTSAARDIDLPFAGTILGVDANAKLPGLMFRLESWTQCGQCYFYNPQNGQLENTGLVPKHPADFSAMELRQAKVRSADGTEIPVSILCRKDLSLDGQNPCIVVAYGSYGISIDPTFDPATLSWLERSGVVAFVHARGGGEFGQAWHESGMKSKKQHSIDDALAACKYMIDSKYTNPKRLAIKGTSAGGIVCGGAITQAPEYFACAIDNVGMTDMLRFQTSQGGTANIPEFGDVNKEEDFKHLYAMSAYHHVKDGTSYPAVLGITGVNDPRVPCWIIAKMVARLQAASTSGRPVLLRVDFDAGHGQGSNRKQRQEQLADERSFMLWQFGVPEFQPKTALEDDFEKPSN